MPFNVEQASKGTAIAKPVLLLSLLCSLLLPTSHSTKPEAATAVRGRESS